MKRLLPEFVNALLIGLGILSASIGLKGFVVFHPLAGAEGGMVKTRGFH